MGHNAQVRRSERRDGSVARQVLLLQVLVVVVLVVASLALATYDARRDARVAATDRAVGVARAVADSPALVAALRTEDPAVRIQPYAEEVRRDTDVDFVTVMALDRTRYSHPDPALIGRPFVGDLGDAPQGGILTQQYTGTLGPSMRAVVPVLDDAGTVVALVSVGITVQAIDQALGDDLVLIAVSAAAVLAVGLLGAWLVSRRLRRQTHGLGEREITRMYEYYSAVLHAVREGLLLIDADGRVQLVNDEARRLLGLPEPVAEGAASATRSWGARCTTSGWPPASSRPPWGAPRSPTTSTSPATACWWSPRPLRRGTATRSARWSPCATTPSCARSPASSTPCGGSRSRCARRTTRPPTGCTPWCRSSRWVAPRRPSTSPPRSSRSPSCWPTGSWAPPATRWWPPCCSARPPRPSSAASSWSSPARSATAPRCRPATSSRCSATSSTTPSTP